MGYADSIAEYEAKEREWLDGLKAGDPVIINYPFSRSENTVDHCTANYIHVGSCKYRRKNGCVVGSSRGSITMPTVEIREQLERERLAGKIAGLGWDFVCRLPLDKLRRISAILDEPADDGDRKNEPTEPGWWRLRMRPDGDWIAVQVTESKAGNNLVVWLNEWDDVLLDHPELLGAQWGPRIDMPDSATDKPADR